MLTTLLSNPKIKAFTYIEVSISLLVFVMMIQSISLCYADYSEKIHLVKQRTGMFSAANNMTQSLLLFSIEKEFGTLFHDENLSPFCFDNDAKYTYPMNYHDFISVFHLSDTGFFQDDSSMVVCTKKNLTVTSKPIFHYVIYVYQNKEDDLKYGMLHLSDRIKDF